MKYIKSPIGNYFFLITILFFCNSCYGKNFNTALSNDTVLKIDSKTLFCANSKIKLRSKRTIIKTKDYTIYGNFDIYDGDTKKIITNKKSIKCNANLVLGLRLNSNGKNQSVISIVLNKKFQKSKIYKVEIVCKPLDGLPFYSSGIGCILKEKTNQQLYFYEKPQIAKQKNVFISDNDTLISGSFYSSGTENVIIIKEFFRERKKNHWKKNYSIYQITNVSIIEVKETDNIIKNGDFGAINFYPLRKTGNLDIVPPWGERFNGSSQVYCKIMRDSLLKGASYDNINVIRRITNNQSNFIGFNLAYFKDNQVYNRSERVVTELKKTLSKGKRYKFSLKVLSSKYNFFNIKSLAIGFIYGAFEGSFAIIKQYNNEEYFDMPTKIVITDEILDNTAEWKTISVEFEAKGNETFLVIGSFPLNDKDKEVKFTGVNLTSGQRKLSYYYFDDIELVELDL